jgi:HSP20 family protein
LTEEDSGKNEGFSLKISASNDIKNRIRELMQEAKKAPKPGGPFIYGFNLRFDPDGNPVFSEFGNVSAAGVHGLEVREPLTDVIERESTVTLIAELPGVDEKDIDVKISEDTIDIKVDAEERKYRKNVKLSCKVNPQSVKSGYKNGVLQIKLDRA